MEKIAICLIIFVNYIIQNQILIIEAPVMDTKTKPVTNYESIKVILLFRKLEISIIWSFTFKWLETLNAKSIKNQQLL